MRLQIQERMKQRKQGQQEQERTQPQQDPPPPAAPEAAEMEGVEPLGEGEGTDGHQGSEPDRPVAPPPAATQLTLTSQGTEGVVVVKRKREREEGKREAKQAGGEEPGEEEEQVLELGNGVGPQAPAHQQAHLTDAQHPNLPPRVHSSNVDPSFCSPPHKLQKQPAEGGNLQPTEPSSIEPPASPTPLLLLDDSPRPAPGTTHDRDNRSSSPLPPLFGPLSGDENSGDEESL